MHHAVFENHLASLNLGKGGMGGGHKGPGHGKRIDQMINRLRSRMQGGLPAKGEIRDGEFKKCRTENSQIKKYRKNLGQKKDRPEKNRSVKARLTAHETGHGLERESLTSGQGSFASLFYAHDQAPEESCEQRIKTLKDRGHPCPGNQQGQAQDHEQSQLGNKQHPDASENIDGGRAAVRQQRPGQARAGQSRRDDGQGSDHAHGFKVSVAGQGRGSGGSFPVVFLVRFQPEFDQVLPGKRRRMGFGISVS